MLALAGLIWPILIAFGVIQFAKPDADGKAPSWAGAALLACLVAQVIWAILLIVMFATS